MGALIVGDGGHPLPGSTVGWFPGSAWLTNRLTLCGVVFRMTRRLASGTALTGRAEDAAGSAGTRSEALSSPSGKCVHPYPSSEEGWQ